MGSPSTEASFSIMAKATAPLGAVALAQSVGYGPVMATVAGACVIAAFALIACHRLPSPMVSAAVESGVSS
jgi:hypothetical protein